ncbi:MAG: hypothetical protein E7373_03690 [Clostridiales bacterium]|nr:hypothetical protein [Clostridiales bacterium]
MIECTSEFIWYKKKRLKKPKKLIAFFLTFLIIISIFVYYKTIVFNLIFDICVNYAEKYSAQSVNDAVLISLSDGTKYSDLILIEKDSQGKVILMSANSIKVNLLSREIVNNTLALVEEKLQRGIPVPFMAFSGIGVLSGYGKTINYRELTISKVECEFDSQFTAVGINQTLHSIYVNVVCTINSKAFLTSKNTICQSKVLISETVLIGEVPEIYLSGKLFT